MVCYAPTSRARCIAGEANDERVVIKKETRTIGHEHTKRGRQPAPDWALGLRSLYDSVVEEPLPDSFAKLLDDLDNADV